MYVWGGSIRAMLVMLVMLGPDPSSSSFSSLLCPLYRLIKPSIFPFFASFFFGYILDVTKWTYQMTVPRTERPKMTRNSVMTGRPSASTERRAVGVRIGASQEKLILRGVSVGDFLLVSDRFGLGRGGGLQGQGQGA